VRGRNVRGRKGIKGREKREGERAKGGRKAESKWEEENDRDAESMNQDLRLLGVDWYTLQ
jgi:hypothetical protein